VNLPILPTKRSCHNQGAAVDLILVNRHGKALKLATDLDDFTEKVYRNHEGERYQYRPKSQLLERVMTEESFIRLSTEGWHFYSED